MASTDGCIQVLLNGEIYNWRELRAELESAGHVFASQSDTEVVVQGYQAWEEALIPRLRGMFAIAVWGMPGASVSCWCGTSWARNRSSIDPPKPGWILRPVSRRLP
jgi:hypothetical protein